MEELLRLEQHILCQFLPKSYSQIDYDIAPANLMTMTITSSNLSELTSNTMMLIQREKRLRLANELERYETTIHDFEYQYQLGLTELEQCFAQQTYNGILVIELIKNYFNFKTEKTLRDMTHNLVSFRMKLIYRRRCYMKKKLKIDPSPTVIIDTPTNCFNHEYIAYLSRGTDTLLSLKFSFAFVFFRSKLY